MVDRLRVWFLIACLFLGGSGGHTIAIVALVTINQDQDHFSYPSLPDPPPSPTLTGRTPNSY
jgi:hypothetical protein